MKTKFILKKANGEEKVFYLKRENSKFIAIYNGKEYVPYPEGTMVNYNNAQRIVTKDICLINVEGDNIFVLDKGKFAGPNPSSDSGKVTYSFVGNNLRASSTLLAVFGVLIVAIIIIMIVAK